MSDLIQYIYEISDMKDIIIGYELWVYDYDSDKKNTNHCSGSHVLQREFEGNVVTIS